MELLIEGHLGFPRMEIEGNALATVIGTAMACVISVIAIRTRADFLHFKGLIRERLLVNRKDIKIVLKKVYADQPGIPDKLRVINRYQYSENDTLVLKDYRIALGAD